MNLEKTRKKIDLLDHQLVKLIAARSELGLELGNYKKENNLPIQDRKRELEIIADRIAKFKELGIDDEKFVKELFELIMKKSREMQK